MSQYHDFRGFRPNLPSSVRNPSGSTQPTDQNYFNPPGSHQMHGTNLPMNSAATMPIFPDSERYPPDIRTLNQPKNVNANLYAQALAVKSSLGLLDSPNSSALEALRSYGPPNSSDSPSVSLAKNYLSHSQALDSLLYENSPQHKSGNLPDRPSSREYFNQGDSDSNASTFSGIKPILDINLTSVDDEDEFLYGDSNPSLPEPEKPSEVSPAQTRIRQKEPELTEWNEDERGVISQYPPKTFHFQNLAKTDKKQINVTLKNPEGSVNVDNSLFRQSSNSAQDMPVMGKKDPISQNKSSGENTGKYGSAANFLRQRINFNKPEKSVHVQDSRSRLEELSTQSRKFISEMELQNMSLDNKGNQKLDEPEHGRHQLKNPDLQYGGHVDKSRANEIQPTFLKTKSSVATRESIVPPKNYRTKEVDQYVEHPAEKLKRAFDQVTTYTGEKSSKPSAKAPSHMSDLSSKNRSPIHSSDSLKQRPNDKTSSHRHPDYSSRSRHPDYGSKYRSHRSPDRGMEHSRSRRNRSRSPIRRSERSHSRSPERGYRSRNRHKSPSYERSRRSLDRSPSWYHHERRNRHSSDSSSVESLKVKKPSKDTRDLPKDVHVNKEPVKVASELSPTMSTSAILHKERDAKVSIAGGNTKSNQKFRFTDADCSKVELVDYQKIIFSLSARSENDGKSGLSHKDPSTEVNELPRSQNVEYRLADSLQYLIQLGQTSQLLDNFRKFTKHDSLAPSAKEKEKKLLPASSTETPPSSSVFSQQSVQSLPVPALPQQPELNLTQPSQASVFHESVPPHLPLSIYSQVPPPNLLLQTSQSVYSQASQPLPSPHMYSQSYRPVYPLVPDTLLSGAGGHLQQPPPMQHEGLVQPTMYPTYPYSVPPPSVNYPSVPPPSVTYPSSEPYHPSHTVPSYPFYDETQLPPLADFDSPTKKEKKSQLRVCSLKSVPILSDDQPAQEEPSAPVRSTPSVPQKTPWVEVAKKQEPLKNVSESSSSHDDKKALLAKYNKLLEERDSIKRRMQDASKNTMELRKKKEDLEKKLRASKKCSFSDYEVVKLCKEQYNKANEELKNYIDEAKEINYKVKEMQSKIEPETLQKTEKKSQIEEDDFPTITPPVPTAITYSCYDTGNHWCEQCTKSYSTLGKMMDHLHSVEHLKHVDPFKVLTENETAKDNKSSNSNTTLHPVKGVEFMKPLYAYYCSLCKITLRNRGFAELHLKGHDHTIKYLSYIKENPYYAKKRELLITARIAAAVKAKREKELEKKEKILKGKTDAENKVKAMLQEQKSKEKKVDELDETLVTSQGSNKMKDNGGIKLTLVPEKETRKDKKNLPKQSVIYIGRAPNYKGRQKVNLKKLPDPKKPRLVNEKDSIIEKIIEEINDPNSNCPIKKTPIEETEPISQVPAPQREKENPSFVDPPAVQQSEASPAVPSSQKPSDSESDRSTRSSKKRSRDDDRAPKESKLPQFGCQTESEAKLFKENVEQKFPDKANKDKPNEPPKSKEKPYEPDKGKPDRPNKEKHDKSNKGKHDKPYEPKTDNPVIDQALKNILFGSETVGSSYLSEIELPKSPPKNSAPPLKKKKTENPPIPKQNPQVQKKNVPLSEEEQDFLLLGISKSDLEPIAVPKPPPSALIHGLPENALELPPFPPPLHVPPPSLILQSAPALNLQPDVATSSVPPLPIASKSNITQSQASSYLAVVDMEIDDAPEVQSNIIIHDPLPKENAPEQLSHPRQNVSSVNITLESADSNKIEAANIVLTCSKLECFSNMTSNLGMQIEEAKTCDPVVGLLTSGVPKELKDNSSKDTSNDGLEKGEQISAPDSLVSNIIQSSNSVMTKNSSLVMEGDSAADSCLTGSMETAQDLLGEGAKDLENTMSLCVRKSEEEKINPDGKLCKERIHKQGNSESVTSEVSGQNENISSECDSTQSKNRNAVIEISDTELKTSTIDISENNMIVPNLEKAISLEDDIHQTIKESSTPSDVTILQMDQSNTTESTSSNAPETTLQNTSSNVVTNDNMEKPCHSQVSSHDTVMSDGITKEDNVSNTELTASGNVTCTEISLQSEDTIQDSFSHSTIISDRITEEDNVSNKEPIAPEVVAYSKISSQPKNAIQDLPSHRTAVSGRITKSDNASYKEPVSSEVAAEINSRSEDAIREVISHSTVVGGITKEGSISSDRGDISNEELAASETNSPIENAIQETVVMELDEKNTEASVSIVIEDLPSVLITGSDSSETSSDIFSGSHQNNIVSHDTQLNVNEAEAPSEFRGQIDPVSTLGHFTMAPSRDDSNHEENDDVSKNVLEQHMESTDTAMDLDDEVLQTNKTPLIDFSDADATLPAEPNDGVSMDSEKHCTDSVGNNMEWNVEKPVIKTELNDEDDVLQTDSPQMCGSLYASCLPVLKSEPAESEVMDTSEDAFDKSPKSCQEEYEPEPRISPVTIKTEPVELSPPVYDAEGRSLAELELTTKMALASILLPRLNGNNINSESSRRINIAEALSRNRWDLLFATNQHLEIERAVRQRTSQLLRTTSTYTRNPSFKLDRTLSSFLGGPLIGRTGGRTRRRGEDLIDRDEEFRCPIHHQQSTPSSIPERRDEIQIKEETPDMDEEPTRPGNVNENAFGIALSERNDANSSASCIDRFDAEDDVTFLQSHQSPHLGLFPLPRIFVNRIEQALRESEERQIAESLSTAAIERNLSILSQQATISLQELTNHYARRRPPTPPPLHIKKEEDETREEDSSGQVEDGANKKVCSLFEEAKTCDTEQSSVEERSKEENSLVTETEEKENSLVTETEEKENSLVTETEEKEEKMHSSAVEVKEDEKNALTSASVKSQQMDQKETQSPHQDESAANFSQSSEICESDEVQLIYSRPSTANEIPVIDIADSESEHSGEESRVEIQLGTKRKRSPKTPNSEGNKGQNDSDTDEYEAN